MTLLLTDPPTKKTLFHLPLYYSIDSGDYTITPMNVIRNMNTKHGKKTPTPAAKLCKSVTCLVTLIEPLNICCNVMVRCYRTRLGLQEQLHKSLCSNYRSITLPSLGAEPARGEDSVSFP